MVPVDVSAPFRPSVQTKKKNDVRDGNPFLVRMYQEITYMEV